MARAVQPIGDGFVSTFSTGGNVLADDAPPISGVANALGHRTALAARVAEKIVCCHVIGMLTRR